MNIKVSTIIIAYNIEKYIEKCLDSLINQTFKDLEIIVVNDGSTDSTLEKIEKFKRIDNRIILLNQDNKGPMEARESGLKVARGEYVLFVDGDDWLDIKAIETLYKITQKDNYDIINYGYWMAFEDNNLVEGWRLNIGEELLENEFLENLLKGKITNSIWCKFIRRKFIIDNNVLFPKNISYGEDLAFLISLSVHKPKVYITNECVYYYYQRSDSLTNRVSSKILDITNSILFVKEVLIEFGIFEKYYKEFEYMAYKHNYYSQKNLIYLYKNDIGKEMFNKWKSLNLNMRNNIYYKELYKKEKFKTRVIVRICEKNYLLGKLLNKLIIIKSKRLYF